jgi:hypothetical protein
LVPDENADTPRECFAEQSKGELYELQEKGNLETTSEKFAESTYSESNWKFI